MKKNKDQQTKGGWQIKKDINISLLIMVMLQFTAFVYWVSTIDHITSSNANRLVKLESWKSQNIRDYSLLIQRLAGTESKVQAISDKIKDLQSQNNRIENKLDRALVGAR